MSVLLSVALIGWATLFPFDLQLPADRSLTGAVRDVLTGLDTSALIGHPLDDIPQNLLLFVPLGFALARRRVSIVATAAIAAGISGVVELVQGIALSRTASAVDLLANTAGAVVGVVLARLIGDRIAAIGREVRALPVGARAGACGLGFAVLLAMVAWNPVGAAPAGWDVTQPLLLGNERTGDRPWEGRIERLVMFDVVVDDTQVTSSLDGRAGGSPLINHEFGAPGDGFPPLVPGGATMPHRGPGGVGLGDDAWLRTAGPATAIAGPIEETGEFTLVVAVESADVGQTGPARLVSISDGLRSRNLTLGQQGADLAVRVRTPLTGADGTSPELIVPGVFEPAGPGGGGSLGVVVRHDGATLRVMTGALGDGPLDERLLELAPELSLQLFVFPNRIEQLRLGTVSDSVVHLVHRVVLFAPAALAIAAMAGSMRSTIGRLALVASAVLGAVFAHAVVRHLAVGGGLVHHHRTPLDLFVLAGLLAAVWASAHTRRRGWA